MEKVLIIEDSQDIRENIAEIVELAGYDVLMAENGKVGVKLALDENPDLILCDIMMPELDGYGVLHILSKYSETLNTPFIFLTAKAEKTDVRKGMNLGADDYITKPFDESDLLNTIENRIARSKARESSGSSEPAKLESLFEHKIVRNLKIKDSIYVEGDTPSYFFYIKKGRVKLTKMNNSGKEVVVDLCVSGDFFGFWSILDESEHSNTAECLEDSEIWFLPASDFKKLVLDHSDISAQFLKMVTKNLLIKEHKILDLAYESVRKRVAKAIVELNNSYDENNNVIHASRETIASMAGTSVETAIRMISEFKNDGILEVSGSEIKVLNENHLMNYPF